MTEAIADEDLRATPPSAMIPSWRNATMYAVGLCYDAAFVKQMSLQHTRPYS